MNLRASGLGCLLGLVVAFGATLAQVNPPAALAQDYYYCGFLVPAMTQCSSYQGSIPAQGNRATYPGAGTVSVCEKVVNAGYPYAQVSRRCANGTVASGGDLPNGPSNNCYVGNNDNGQHTVNGKAVTL